MVAEASTRNAPINFCSVFARAAGDDPIGSAWSAKRFLLGEIPLPWPYSLLEARGIPAGIPEAVHELYQTHDDWGVIAIAPDEAYSIPGKTRIVDLDFSATPLAQANRRELIVDTAEAGATMMALVRGEALPASVVIDETPYRDLLVCTHGAIDACCAKFGFPAYRTLRALAEQHPNTRIWRCSHFGGHRFAPTMFDLPDGRYWGFLDDDSLATILDRSGDPETLRGCYRGWAGYDHPAEQLLEREALSREGWQWLDWPQSSEVFARDESGEPVELAITAHRPDGSTVRYRGAIEIAGEITTMHTTNGDPAQVHLHRVANLERTVTGA